VGDGFLLQDLPDHFSGGSGQEDRYRLTAQRMYRQCDN
jgi:hypothetical protein